MNLLYFKNNNITLNRADSFSMEFKLEDDSAQGYYDLETGDNLYFALMEPRQKWEDALIRQVYTQSVNGIVTITLSPADTEFLLPGTYYYQIKLKLNSGEVKTLRQKTRFTLVD